VTFFIAALAAIGLALVLGSLRREPLLAAATAAGYLSHPQTSQVLDAASYRDFVIPADSQWPTAYRIAYMIPAMVNNGLALPRANVRPGQTLFTFGYSDPFVMALGLPPNTCGPLWWNLNFDFDARVHPSAQCAISDATRAYTRDTYPSTTTRSARPLTGSCCAAIREPWRHRGGNSGVAGGRRAAVPPCTTR
jgi:hypothetical protein